MAEKLASVETHVADNHFGRLALKEFKTKREQWKNIHSRKNRVTNLFKNILTGESTDADPVEEEADADAVLTPMY